jgi:hypothetical protein
VAAGCCWCRRRFCWCSCCSAPLTVVSRKRTLHSLTHLHA